MPHYAFQNNANDKQRSSHNSCRWVEGRLDNCTDKEDDARYLEYRQTSPPKDIIQCRVRESFYAEVVVHIETIIANRRTEDY